MVGSGALGSDSARHEGWIDIGGAGPPPTGGRRSGIAGELPRTNHFGFRLAGEAAVRAARDRFRAAGVAETEWQDDGRFVRVQVADPDGYRVEVYAHC